MTLACHARPRRTLLAALGLSTGLVLGLAGCGGSGNSQTVPLPPGGVAIGNLVCIGTTMEPNTNQVAQGQHITMTFHLVDVNTHVPGALLPVSFDVEGGSLANPPDHTDADGTVSVLFTAGATYYGNGRVRLIQPDAQLDCDVSFTVLAPVSVITSEVVDGANATVTPTICPNCPDACGSTENDVERQWVRKIVYTVERPDPITNVLEPVQGAYLRLVATGMSFSVAEIGPTDANGMITHVVTPFPTGIGHASVTATVVRPDATGPNGTPDGSPDILPSNSCTVTFNIINPICDAVANSEPPTVEYHRADSVGGAVKAGPLLPGEYARITTTFDVDNMPADSNGNPYPVFVDAVYGYINGSSAPVHIVTDPNNNDQVTVTYTAADGYQGTDTVTFAPDRGDLSCTHTASVDVLTCSWAIEFSPAPQSGMDSVVTATLSNVDPDTAEGHHVTMNVVGGYFVNQPPYFTLDSNMQVMGTIHFTPGFTGPSTLSMSFPGGPNYPCVTTSVPFTVAP